MTLGRRFARLVTDVAVRRPVLWKLFRRPLQLQFDRLAPTWDEGRAATHLQGFESALALVADEPGRVLDLGTGTGSAAFAIARRWPQAEVVGVDVSGRMVEEARRKLPRELAGRVRFEQADAASLPFADASFDVVALSNAIPFFDEIARVLAPGGHVVIGASSGPQTPIYVSPERLRDELGKRGFGGFREVSAGRATGFLARNADRH